MHKSQTFSYSIVVNRAMPTHTYLSNEQNTVGSQGQHQSSLNVFLNGTIIQLKKKFHDITKCGRLW